MVGFSSSPGNTSGCLGVRENQTCLVQDGFGKEVGMMSGEGEGKA